VQQEFVVGENSMTPWFITKMLAWYANGTNKHDFSTHMVILVESNETKQGSSGMSEKGVGTSQRT
jgi:hypothetical protein